MIAVNDRRSSALFDHAGRELISQAGVGPARMDSPAPVIPDGAVGGWSWGMYDAVNYTGNRAVKPFFATDSRVSLNNWTRTRAMSLSRWGYINVHFVRGAVDLFARLVVGTGFSPKTHLADKALADAADAYYLDKTSDIGFMHGESMDELLLHDSRGVDVDGDLGYVMTEDELHEPKLQLIEAHRIKNGDKDNPNLRDGVWVDNYGRRVAFNVMLPEERDSRRIEAKDFIYLAERNRPDELRSMTNLIHALAPLQDLYEYLGFTMASAKRQSEIAAVLETENPMRSPFGPMFSQPVMDATPATTTAPAQPRQVITREMIYAGGGKIPRLGLNEKLHAFEPKNPGPNFDQLPVFIIRGISVGYGIPFEVLWNPEAIGGANTRLITALLRARLNQRRAALIFPKLSRVRFWILSRGIKKGDLPRADYRKHEWQPNFSDITVDAGREMSQRRENVLRGLGSWTGFHRENGESYIGEQLEVRKNDVRAQMLAARDLVLEFPEVSFGEALARIALLTQQASEVQQKVVGADDTSLPPSLTKNTP